MHYNGFVVEAHEGDFDGGALVPESEEQVFALPFPSRNITFSTEKQLTSVFAVHYCRRQSNSLKEDRDG